MNQENLPDDSIIRYVKNRKTGEIEKEITFCTSWLRWLYNNPFGEFCLKTVINKKLTSSIFGRLMDMSISKRKIKNIVKTLNINMEESEKQIKDFRTFNDFFTRKLKSGARPINKDDSNVCSPTDGKVLVFEKIKSIDKFFIKGEKFILSKFLQDEKLASKYENGSLMIIRSTPSDYHRFHFPVSGIIGALTKINGKYDSVSPYAIRKNIRIFCENKREHTIIKTEKFGDVIMIEIGATFVGSIIQIFCPNSTVKKGQEKGYFKFGGSTVALIFESGKVIIDHDLLKNTTNMFETKVMMGERIAKARS